MLNSLVTTENAERAPAKMIFDSRSRKSSSQRYIFIAGGAILLIVWYIFNGGIKNAFILSRISSDTVV